MTRFFAWCLCVTMASMAVAASIGTAQPAVPAQTGTVGQPGPSQGLPQPSPSPGGPPGQPGLPARDASARPVEAEKPTGVIRGRVVALETGQPLRRVQLRIAGEKIRRPRSATTDAEGRYEISELAAGRYTLFASKGGYVSLSHGQRGPRDQGRPIEMAAGQTLEKVDFLLPRGSVITGRIVDELGEPVANVTVSPLQYRVANGKRRLTGTSAGGGATNDIGQFRLFGLPPGEYYVRASYQDGLFGDDDSSTTPGYGTTYYPGTPNPAEAQKVTVNIGEEVSVDFQLVPTRLSRISGIAVDSTGKPIPMGFVTMMRRGAFFDGAGDGMRGGIIDKDGTFSISGVSAGTYSLLAGGLGGLGGFGGSPEDGVEIARLTVTVGGEDLTGVRLVATKGGTVRGRLTFEGGPPPDRPMPHVFCTPDDEETGMNMSFGRETGGVKHDLTFELKNVFGPCVLSAGAGAEEWTLKAVRQGGTDITEQLIDVPADKPVGDVEVVLTNQLTTLSGSVSGDNGAAVKDYAVVVFPEDKALWTQRRPYVRLRTARPDQEGQFQIRGLRPGDYLIVALEHMDEGDEQDPEMLERLQSLATPAKLPEGGKQTVALKLSRLPTP